MSTVANVSGAPSRRVSKVERILYAAGELFRERGFGPTSMDAVAQAADVSKATLYQYFSGKDELFAAMIAEGDDRHARALLACSVAPGEIRGKLLRCGRAILDLLLAPETVGTYRLVLAEALRVPQLAAAYYDNGAARLLSRLEAFFADAMASGTLRQAHPRRAAEQFIGLVRGDLQLRALLGVSATVTDRQKEAVIRGGVDVFFRAYNPNATSTDPA